MHIHTVSALILSFLTPCLFGAPVYDHRRALMALRTVSAIHNSKVTSHIPAQASHQASVHSLSTGDGALCPSGEGKRGSTPCLSGSSPSLGQEGKDIFVHPETKKGPDHTTTKRVTLGGMIGVGGGGAVYDVANHELNTRGNLVAKSIFPTMGSPHAEINTLRKVGQLHGSGAYGGHIWAVSDKMPGVPLTETKTFKDAFRSGPEAFKHVTKHSKRLAGQEVLNMADKHGVLHADVHHGNVLFEETGDVPGNRKLTKAHLVDWGRASDAPPKDPNTQQYTPQQKAKITQLPGWRSSVRRVLPRSE